MTVHSVRVKTSDVVMWLVRLILHFSCCQTVTLFIKKPACMFAVSQKGIQTRLSCRLRISQAFHWRALIVSLPTSFFPIHFAEPILIKCRQTLICVLHIFAPKKVFVDEYENGPFLEKNPTHGQLNEMPNLVLNKTKLLLFQLNFFCLFNISIQKSVFEIV